MFHVSVMELERTDFIGRLGALLIDTLLLTALYVGIVGAASVILSQQGIFHPSDAQAYNRGVFERGELGFAYMTDGLLYLNIIMVLLSLLFHLIEVAFAASPGKLVMGIVVRDEEGGPAPVSQLILRMVAKQSPVILYVIGAAMSSATLLAFSFLSFLVLFFGWFRAIGFERQALHDKFAMTALYGKAAVADYEQLQAQKLAEQTKHLRPQGKSSERDPARPDPNKELVKW